MRKRIKIPKTKGLSALPTILLISGIILEVVIAGLSVSQSFNKSVMSEKLSIEALKIAESGAQDAIMRVNDYMDCPSEYCPSLYSLTVGSGEACVSIGEITY